MTKVSDRCTSSDITSSQISSEDVHIAIEFFLQVCSLSPFGAIEQTASKDPFSKIGGLQNIIIMLLCKLKEKRRKI